MTTPSWDTGSLLQLSGSYWQTFTLHAGVKLGVFSVLAKGSMDAENVAQETRADVRGMAFLLNALSAMGLLEKEAELYRNTPAAQQFLDKHSSKYIGHMIMHHHHLAASWGRMDVAVRTGRPLDTCDDHDEDQRREAFLMGMYNIASQQAPEIASEIDLRSRRSLLDLGGGPGTYAIHFCKRNPDLQAVIYDLPTTQPFAEKTVAQHGLSDRISFTPGDYIKEDLPLGHFDVVWISHILHSEGPASCAHILAKAMRALAPGGTILVHDFFLNDTLDGPVFPALFALNMLQATEEGQSYSESRVQNMLEETGFTDIVRLAYKGPTDSGILQGYSK